MANRIQILYSFCRYLLVGSSSFAVDLLFFLALVHYWGLSPLKAQIFSRTAGATYGFIGHKYFSFAQPNDAHGRKLSIQTVGYVAIAISGIIISPLVLKFMIQAISSNLVLEKIATEAIMVCLNFIAMRVLFVPQPTKHDLN